MLERIASALAGTHVVSADYTPSLLTVAGTLIAAGFTSVIAQYFFAPTLEARKQRILDRSKVACETADVLRAMYFQLEVLQMKRFQLKDMFGFERQELKLQELSAKFDAALSLSNAGLKEKYTTLALKAQFAAELFNMLNRPESKDFEPLMKLLHHTMTALDPANLPWVRAYHCWRGKRLYAAMELPSEATQDA